MESLPRLSGGRALSPDMLCRDSEEPGCRGGVLPDDSTGQSPDSLASFARHSDFSREGVKAVTSKILTDPPVGGERHGAQGKPSPEPPPRLRLSKKAKEAGYKFY